jgi:hypothetical protein
MSPLSIRAANKRRHRGISFSHVVAFLGGMTVATLFMTFFQGRILHATGSSDRFAGGLLKSDPSAGSTQIVAAPPDVHIAMADEQHSTHGVAGLDCSAHGGPNSAEITQDLVYWKDMPLDNEYISPLRSSTVRQYLTFEPDGGELSYWVSCPTAVTKYCWSFLSHSLLPIFDWHTRRWLEQYSNVNGKNRIVIFCGDINGKYTHFAIHGIF